MNDLKEALEKIIAVPVGYHAAAQMEGIARAALAAQPPAAPVEKRPPGAGPAGATFGGFEPLSPPQSCSAETARLDWQTASQADCSDALYQIGGALRRIGRFDLAQSADKIAEELYYGEIKPAPIVPRTTT